MSTYLHQNLNYLITNRMSIILSITIKSEKKITLEIYTRNDKESKNLIIHKTKWKSIFDVKKYVMEQNHESTFDHQTIKYMGEVISNNNIKFEYIQFLKCHY